MNVSTILMETNLIMMLIIWHYLQFLHTQDCIDFKTKFQAITDKEMN